MSNPFANPYGPDPIDLTPQAQAFYDRYLPIKQEFGTNPVEPKITAWLSGGKPVYKGGELPWYADINGGPGDVMVIFPGDDDGKYGHTEVITPQQARHYRRQTLRYRVRLFLARLADSVRGQK